MIIKGNTIPDVWFQSLYNIFDYGIKYTIDKGSMEGESRLQYEYITLIIDNPYLTPWSDMLPEIPSNLNIPNPVTSEYLNSYVTYLMTDCKEPGEDYTYGERMSFQIDHWINILKIKPNTNQAILQVAKPDDCYLNDPPCLRHVAMNIYDNKLNFYPYFRSWDLWNGLPANLAGLAIVQKYIADELSINVGKMIATSNGLHIYGYAEEIARLRTYKHSGG